jgi:hypothetical protein
MAASSTIRFFRFSVLLVRTLVPSGVYDGFGDYPPLRRLANAASRRPRRRGDELRHLRPPPTFTEDEEERIELALAERAAEAFARTGLYVLCAVLDPTVH